jgi:acyl-CoA dehydrogenase
MPFAEQVIESFHMGLADGPTEVHKVTVARQLLREYGAVEGMWPSEHIPTRRAEAITKLGLRLEHSVGNT